MTDRRTFLKTTALTSGFFALGFVDAEGKGSLFSKLLSDTKATDLNQFIAIGTDNSITLFNHRPEMGQGTFTSIPMVLAEELGVDMDDVVIMQSEADRDRYGSQMVVGSRSIQTEFNKLRKMGAAAREMLIQAAADEWDVETSTCSVANGHVIHSSGKKLSFGSLAEQASQLTPPENPTVKDPADFKIIGTEVMRRDIPAKTDGSAIFGLDIYVPEMLIASIERSPVFLGKVKDFNKDEVLAQPGVKHVFKTSRQVFGNTREGVAILADNHWNAIKARKVLKVEWDNLEYDKIDGLGIQSDYMQENTRSGTTLFSRGSELQASDDQVHEAVYETPYQAHVPMEPMNAVVHIGKDGAEFWGSTQNPNGIRSFIAQKYDLDPGKVRINYTYMGGGFGRRSLTDVVEEAADLSAQSGAPVKVIWTREDDLTQGPFRACSLNTLKGKLDDSGKLITLEHKVVAQEIRNQTGDNMEAGRQLMGGINTEYQVPNLFVKGVLQKRHIPISYWRAVYHSTNPFAHESFIDEMAHKAGMDPIDFRLGMLEHPRYRRVLEEVRKYAEWDNPKPGIGRGVATVERSGAYFAMVVEVSQQGEKVLPIRVITALDLGICINPNTVKAQTEGSVIMGLGAAYYGLNIESGRVKESNFHDYPLPRIDQTPEIVTYILPGTADPDGAGESGLPTVAPALANAIFDLTDERIRKLPLPERFIP